MKIAVVDLESTGPSLDKGDRIIQIGAVLIEDGVQLAEYNMLINPEREIPQHISLLTGIEQEAVDKAPTFESVASLWYTRLKDCVFVAHNLAHDLNFMKQHFEWSGFDFKPSALDTVKLAKVLFPQAKGFNLAALSQEFQLDFENAHDALADAQLTVKVLHQLAAKVSRLDQKTQHSLLPFIKAFDHEEILIFNHPEAFKLRAEDNNSSDNPEDPIQQAAEREAVSTNGLAFFNHQAQFILENWQKQHHLIVESAVRPLKREVLFQLVLENLKLEKPAMILALAQVETLMEWKKRFDQETAGGDYPKQPKISLLLNPSHYINQAEFYDLIEKVPINKFNQQEMIITGAAIVWLMESTTGNLNELNHELTIQSVLNRYKREAILKKSSQHYYYEQALLQAKKADLVLTNHAFIALASLNSDNLQVGKQPGRYGLAVEIFKNRSLVVDNLSLLLRQLRLQASRKFALSQTLTKLQQVIDSFYNSHHLAGWQQEVSALETVRDRIVDYMMKLENYLRDLFETIEGPVSRELYIEPASLPAQLFDQMKQDLIPALKGLEKLEDFDLKQPEDLRLYYKMKELIKNIKQLAYFNNSSREDHSSYLILRADQYDHSFYQISWIQKVLTVAPQVSDFFHAFKAGLFISPGDAKYRQKTGTYQALGLDGFKYLRLEPPKMPAIEMVLPGEFLESKKDFDHSFDSQIKRLALLIDQQWFEEKKLLPLTLVVINNRQQALDAYRMLRKKLSHIEQLMVLSQHVSGSLNKIKRYVYELKPVVVIIQWQSILNHQWGIDDLESDLYWVRLPFNSLENSQIRAKADYLKLEEEEVFSKILLPQMMDDWVIALDFFDQAFDIHEWSLLDERIFTKYYSSEIRKGLEETIQFNLKYE